MDSTQTLAGMYIRQILVVCAALVLLALGLALMPVPVQAAGEGTLEVGVTAKGVPVALTRDYVLGYTCTDGQEGVMRVPGTGALSAVDATFPVGTRCTVVADAEDLDLPGYTAVATGGRGAPARSVVIGAESSGNTAALVEIVYEGACRDEVDPESCRSEGTTGSGTGTGATPTVEVSAEMAEPERAPAP